MTPHFLPLYELLPTSGLAIRNVQVLPEIGGVGF